MQLFICLLISSMFLQNNVCAQTIAIPGRPDESSLPYTFMKAMAERRNITLTFPYNKISGDNLSTIRMQQDLINGKLDVFWSMTSVELENNFNAIYIPIFRGLLGMRIPLVKRENANLFRSVKSLDDLRKFKAGSGNTWPDTAILEHNALPVVKTLKYQNLFPMLEGDRFDYFPRGLHEPWQEVIQFNELDLAVENTLLIQYTAPNYFFVAKDNTKLAQQLTDIFNELIENGDFVKLFFKDEEVTNALNKANVKNRIIFKIDNPTLSPKTPITRKELWFDPLEMKGNQ